MPADERNWNDEEEAIINFEPKPQKQGSDTSPPSPEEALDLETGKPASLAPVVTGFPPIPGRMPSGMPPLPTAIFPKSYQSATPLKPPVTVAPLLAIPPLPPVVPPLILKETPVVSSVVEAEAIAPVAKIEPLLATGGVKMQEPVREWQSELATEAEPIEEVRESKALLEDSLALNKELKMDSRQEEFLQIPLPPPIVGSRILAAEPTIAPIEALPPDIPIDFPLDFPLALPPSESILNKPEEAKWESPQLDTSVKAVSSPLKQKKLLIPQDELNTIDPATIMDVPLLLQKEMQRIAESNPATPVAPIALPEVAAPKMTPPVVPNLDLKMDAIDKSSPELKIAALEAETVPEVGLLVLMRTPSSKLHQIFRIDSARMELGRSLDATIFLDDKAVSMRHSAIRYEKRGDAFEFVLYDLASTNGTYLNGQRISSTVLKDNDRIEIGESVLAFKKVT